MRDENRAKNYYMLNTSDKRREPGDEIERAFFHSKDFSN
jgi:hypothetical protein